MACAVCGEKLPSVFCKAPYSTIATYHISMQLIQNLKVKLLMVGGTNSMVGYHLMDEGHSVKLGVRVGWGGGGR